MVSQALSNTHVECERQRPGATGEQPVEALGMQGMASVMNLHACVYTVCVCI